MNDRVVHLDASRIAVDDNPAGDLFNRMVAARVTEATDGDTLARVA